MTPMVPKKYKKPTHHYSLQGSNTSSLLHSMLGDRSQQLHNNNQSQLQHQSSSAATATSTSSANPNINVSASVGSMINTNHTKTISNLVSIKDPNQYTESVHTSSSSPADQDYSQTFELDGLQGVESATALGVDDWMYSESAPGYDEYSSPDGGQGGEEDVLPGPVPASSDTASTADNIYTDERPLPFVDTILSRRAKTLAKPEAEDGAFWHYRCHVKDKAEVN
ncbi:hypothetical protein K457DRAFT_158276 [Linnemannia elongata AG-77]|uniref:Uncharacterized protein n=1 Tax=Linnemannia elongata AG-77 TaxID=1314771 RepID=A0A197JLH4_9FUNG|nr:hypothetical protein K457DRAFT_158276 [Linnemannia elongata AG-77]